MYANRFVPGSLREPSALYDTTGTPASSALSTGLRNAFLSTTASARPSALALIAVLVASTISATTEFCDPVHWYSQPSNLAASAAPYWVGVKNGLVVTWQTKTNFHFGVFGKLPTAPATGLSSVQALNNADAANEALARPPPASSRRRVAVPRPRVSTASVTFG